MVWYEHYRIIDLLNSNRNFNIMHCDGYPTNSIWVQKITDAKTHKIKAICYANSRKMSQTQTKSHL